MVDGRGSERGATAITPMTDALKRHQAEAAAASRRLCRIRAFRGELCIEQIHEFGH